MSNFEPNLLDVFDLRANFPSRASNPAPKEINLAVVMGSNGLKNNIAIHIIVPADIFAMVAEIAKIAYKSILC